MGFNRKNIKILTRSYNGPVRPLKTFFLLRLSSPADKRVVVVVDDELDVPVHALGHPQEEVVDAATAGGKEAVGAAVDAAGENLQSKRRGRGRGETEQRLL